MSGTEWFLLVVVVIGLPLLVAVVVTLWTLEMARQRNKKNRPKSAIPVKRKATRATGSEGQVHTFADVDRGSDDDAGPDSDGGDSGSSGESGGSNDSGGSGDSGSSGSDSST